MGYEWLDGEPRFDPERDLAIEEPEEVIMLTDLGYTAADIDDVATPVAASSPFRVLSDIGAQTMLHTARRLRTFSRRAGERIENTVRGGCYRSRWLRDLCISPEVSEVMARVYGTDVAPHSMPVQLGHLNYEPTREPDTPVDKWHHDTIPLDYVMMVTDPAALAGGEFEYFVGTKAEAAELAAEGQTPPADRVVAPEFAGPGYAIALHGNMIVHRAAALAEHGERITMVNAYVSLDRRRDDQNRARDLIGVDDPEVLYAEWVRHAAWRAVGRLEALGEEVTFGVDSDTAAAALESAIADVQQAIADMRAGQGQIHHYE